MSEATEKIRGRVAIAPMPTSIIQSFTQFRQNLEISGLQSTTVSTRQSNVREILQRDLQVTDSFLTGSYSRSTMIAPLSEADVDIFVVLESKYFYNYNGTNGGQAGLLDLVKRTLRKTYTRTPDIARSGQAVTVRFEDFLVDVVPAFVRQGGGFLIPNSHAQSWISTDPKKHVEISTAANNAHNQDLVPLVKMLKAWNRNNGNLLRSFHLEVLIWAALHNVRISDFSSGARFFFDKARSLTAGPIYDPAGYGGNVADYLVGGQRTQDVTTKLQTAYDSALRAEQHAAHQRFRDAITTWRGIFGDYFPAYG